MENMSVNNQLHELTLLDLPYDMIKIIVSYINVYNVHNLYMANKLFHKFIKNEEYVYGKLYEIMSEKNGFFKLKEQSQKKLIKYYNNDIDLDSKLSFMFHPHYEDDIYFKNNKINLHILVSWNGYKIYPRYVTAKYRLFVRPLNINESIDNIVKILIE